MSDNNIPIIGESSINPGPDDPPMRMVQKAFMMIQQPDGRWMASSDIATPTETFMAVTPEDVMQGCQRVREGLLGEEQASLQVHMNMQVARQMQDQAQNAQLINSLKI